MDGAWTPGEFENIRDGLERAWRGVESALDILRGHAGAPKGAETAARAERDKAYYVYATALRILDSRKDVPSPNMRVVVRGAIRKLARFEASLSAPPAPRRPILDQDSRASGHGAIDGHAPAEGPGATAALEGSGAGRGARGPTGDDATTAGRSTEDL